MRNIRRWPIAACVGLISVLTALGCGSNEKSTAPPVKPGKGSASSNAEKRIIILTNGESPFWDAARQGMEAAEKDLKLADSGLKAVLEVNNRDEEGQLDQLRQYVSQTDIAAVGISVTKENNVAIVDQLRQLRKNGVHVITLDSDVNRAKFRDARVAYVGTDK